MRIDAHHHLWDLSRRPQPWMDGPWADPIARTYTLDDLLPHLDAHGIDATVVVQSSRSYQETRELIAAAAASGGRIAGVVGWTDLTEPAPDLPEGLCGVRHQVQDEADPRWLCRAEVRRGLSRVADAGLVYDLLVTPRELPAALETVRDLPGLLFVLDHAAKPPVASGGWEPWATMLTELARLPNVMCKLSGLITEADWEKWRPQDVLPYARHVLDTFGPDRVMFGSDWPVCTLAGRYEDVLVLAEQATTPLTPAERAAVLGGTATRTYRLEVPSR
jgi:L-fuconolactonase